MAYATVAAGAFTSTLSPHWVKVVLLVPSAVVTDSLIGSAFFPAEIVMTVVEAGALEVAVSFQLN